jgi:hypothetical protein
MKKILVCGIFLGLSALVCSTPALAGVQGDVNGDGDVNALDITKVERVIAGLDEVTEGSDVNGDGSVNALDLTSVERIIVGLPIIHTQGQAMVVQTVIEQKIMVPYNLVRCSLGLM